MVCEAVRVPNCFNTVSEPLQGSKGLASTAATFSAEACTLQGTAVDFAKAAVWFLSACDVDAAGRYH